MTSVVAGKIKKYNDKSVVVDLFEGNIKRKFDNIDDAIEFAKFHCIGLLKTDETSAVSIKYVRADERASFIIFERMINEEGFEYLEYEETAYDYILSHDPFFKGHRTRKMINERYYSYHDFARVSTLTSSTVAYARIGVSILAMLISIVFLLYGLHAINMSSIHNHLKDYEVSWLNTYVALGFLITFSVGAIACASYALPLIKLNKVNWNYDDIDWRRLSRMRRKLKIANMSITLVGAGLSVHFMYIYLTSALWLERSVEAESMPFLIITLITVFIFLVIGGMAVTNMLANARFRKKNINKYFTPKQVEGYHKWINMADGEVTYKTDNKYFVIPFEKSHEIVLAKLAMIQEVMRTSTKEEVREYKKKSLYRYHIAVKQYMKQLKNEAKEIKHEEKLELQKKVREEDMD